MFLYFDAYSQNCYSYVYIIIYQSQNSVIDVATCYVSDGTEFESWETKVISSFPHR
jgi:hypothetical protein